MNEFLVMTVAAVKGAAMLTGKVVVPGAIPFVMFASGVIDGTTLTPMTIVGAVGGACWYLNGRLTRIEDAIAGLQKDVADINEPTRK